VSPARISHRFPLAALSWAIFLGGDAWPAPDPPPAAPRDVGALLAAFAANPGFEAEFAETKTIALLSAPLETRGRIYFRRPDRLLRVVESPVRARVLVTPHEVKMRSDGKVERLALGTMPEVRALVSSLLGLLAGDRAALEEAHAPSLELLDGGRWRLTLVPRSKRLAALVGELRFEGRAAIVERITVREASGDVSVTEVLRPDPTRVFPEGALDRLFESPGT
jgi:hypothetical protein